MVALIVSLLIPILVGCSMVAYLVHPLRISVLMVLALGILIGLGAVPQTILVLDTIGLEWSLINVHTSLALIGGVFVTLRFMKKKNFLEQSSEEQQIAGVALYDTDENFSGYFRLGFYAILAYILFISYIIYWKALNLPVFAWDSLATAIFKSKIFYHERDLSLLQYVPRPSYPLQIPLLGTWVSMNLGEWNDQLYKVIFPLYFSAFAILQYYFLRCYTRRTWALLGVSLLFASEFCVMHASTSYRDITMMTYNCGAMYLLVMWFSRRKDCLLILAGLLAGFGTFTKLEGNGHLLIHLIVLAGMLCLSKDQWRRRGIQMLKFAIPAFLPVVFYLYVKTSHGVIVAERAGVGFEVDYLTRIIPILIAFVKYTLLYDQWNVLYAVVVLSLFNLYRQKHQAQTYWLLISLFLFFGLIFAVLFLTENYDLVIGFYEEVNLPRLFLHFFPLVPAAIILLNFSGQREAQ